MIHINVFINQNKKAAHNYLLLYKIKKPLIYCKVVFQMMLCFDIGMISTLKCFMISTDTPKIGGFLNSTAFKTKTIIQQILRNTNASKKYHLYSIYISQIDSFNELKVSPPDTSCHSLHAPSSH